MWYTLSSERIGEEMKLLKLRERLSWIGLLLLEHGDGFLVTNNGVKEPIDLEFADLAEVEQWMRDQRHANRLTDEDDAEWDAQYKAFCEAWRDVQCPDCEHVNPMKMWKEKNGCCPSCGEGQEI